MEDIYCVKISKNQLMHFERMEMSNTYLVEENERLEKELKVLKLEHQVVLDSLTQRLHENAELRDENAKLKNFLEQLQSTLVDAYENIYGILEDK